MLWTIPILVTLVYLSVCLALRHNPFNCRHRMSRKIETHAGMTKALCLECGCVFLKSYAKQVEKTS